MRCLSVLCHFTLASSSEPLCPHPAQPTPTPCLLYYISIHSPPPHIFYFHGSFTPKYAMALNFIYIPNPDVCVNNLCISCNPHVDFYSSSLHIQCLFTAFKLLSCFSLCCHSCLLLIHVTLCMNIKGLPGALYCIKAC